MGKYLVSIIVPCYNVEKLVIRCLDSIYKQSIGFDKLELILVNDASTDGTLEVLEKWAIDKGDNIHIITYDENIRQGGARNKGIKAATSDWITFVDADDWLEDDAIEILLEPLKDRDYDCVRAKLFRTDGKDILINEYEQQDSIVIFKSIGDGKYSYEPANQPAMVLTGIIPALYKRAIILENEVWFPERLAYEDNCWGALYELYVGKLYCIDRRIYNYYQNPASTVNARNKSYQLDRLKTEIILIEEYKKRGVFEILYVDILRRFINVYYLNSMYMFFTSFDDIPDVFDEMKQTINRLFPNYKTIINLDDYYECDQYLLNCLDQVSNPTKEELNTMRDSYNGIVYKTNEIGRVANDLFLCLGSDNERFFGIIEAYIDNNRDSQYSLELMEKLLVRIIKGVSVSDDVFLYILETLARVYGKQQYIELYNETQKYLDSNS